MIALVRDSDDAGWSWTMPLWSPYNDDDDDEVDDDDDDDDASVAAVRHLHRGPTVPDSRLLRSLPRPPRRPVS